MNEKSLRAVITEIKECQKCEFAKKRNRVPGEGTADAHVMFIGDYPGEEENKAGRPFVGPSGQLFRKFLQYLNIGEEEIFITNALKCLPPRNRAGAIILKSDLDNCKVFTHKLIYALDPILIICLGEQACKQLLDADIQPMAEMGLLTQAHIPGELIGYKIPVGILPNPAYMLKEFGGALKKKEIPLEMQQYVTALQAYFILADELRYLRTGIKPPQRGETFLGAPLAIDKPEMLKPDVEALQRWEEILEKLKK